MNVVFSAPLHSAAGRTVTQVLGCICLRPRCSTPCCFSDPVSAIGPQFCSLLQGGLRAFPCIKKMSLRKEGQAFQLLPEPQRPRAAHHTC